MEEREIRRLIFHTMQDISKDIKNMRFERQKESPRGFHQGESFDTSHLWREKTVAQPSSQCSTMPTFLSLEGEEGKPLREETLGDYCSKY